MPKALPEPDVVTIRTAKPGDARAIARIDERHTGVSKGPHWKALVDDCRRSGGVALVAEKSGNVVGYLLGSVRAWEFGSPPAGWIFAVGVDPDAQGDGVGRRLMEAARTRFAEDGISRIRTMVRREDVVLLRFFRSAGFVAGPFVELEAGSGRS